MAIRNKYTLSQRMLDEYKNYTDFIQAGRKNPVWFSEYVFGIKLTDEQKWCLMSTWDKPFALWLKSRGTGKTTLAAVYLMDKMILIPNYTVWISANSLAQSIEVFTKLEDIALKRIPSFKTLTDVFSSEINRTANSETGFIHDPVKGYTFSLFNNSKLTTLSTNIQSIRGKRGSVFADECAWQNAEQMASIEHYADVDSNFSLGVGLGGHRSPIQMPLQLLYASSAGDVTYPFYEKYQQFSKKMVTGDPNYFVCNIDVNTILDHSTVDGVPIESYITREMVQKAIDEDPELAERELFNRFRKGAGVDSLITMDSLIRNSVPRIPLMFNDTGKRKFIFCYDPARNFDGSILSIWEVINDPKVGYRLRLHQTISMVDPSTRKKTPLPMPEQLDIIKELMIQYNGERAAEWENIEFYIDSGSGGGGISAVADQLMMDWTDSRGATHRGIIDPEHKQYETARRKYPNAMPIVHLVDPQSHKKLMFDALDKMIKLNLMEFTEYENKDYILIEAENGEFNTYMLSDKERLMLVQNNLMKTELSYICRFETPNGGVQYELARDKRNKMHDDRAYTAAMAAYVLSSLRRDDILKKAKVDTGPSIAFQYKAPTHGGRRIGGGGWATK